MLPFLPLALEDQLFLDHLGDLFCLLHQVGLLDPEYHVAPIKNRMVTRKSHSTSELYTEDSFNKVCHKF